MSAEAWEDDGGALQLSPQAIGAVVAWDNWRSLLELCPFMRCARCSSAVRAGQVYFRSHQGLRLPGAWCLACCRRYWSSP